MIVGAHKDRATTFGYRAIGGEEKHTLTVEEMPAHDHKYTWQILADGGNFQHVWASTHSKKFPNDPGRADGLTKTTKTGGQSDGTTKRHNNMPPFIALYFCKKV